MNTRYNKIKETLVFKLQNTEGRSILLILWILFLGLNLYTQNSIADNGVYKHRLNYSRPHNSHQSFTKEILTAEDTSEEDFEEDGEEFTLKFFDDFWNLVITDEVLTKVVLNDYSYRLLKGQRLFLFELYHSWKAYLD